MTRNGGGEWEPHPASTEGFGKAVETSHATAYRETCAATRVGVRGETVGFIIPCLCGSHLRVVGQNKAAMS